MSTGKIEHKHMMVRAEVEYVPEYTALDEGLLNSSLNTLARELGMKVVLPSRAHYVDTSGNEGWTANLGLSTSHIALHIWDNPNVSLISRKDLGLMQLDVYTCGCLDQKEIDIILEWFDKYSPVKLEYIVIDRASGFKQAITQFNEVSL